MVCIVVYDYMHSWCVFLASTSRIWDCWSVKMCSVSVSLLHYVGVHVFLSDTTLHIDFTGWYSYVLNYEVAFMTSALVTFL